MTAVKLYAICWRPERTNVKVPAQGDEFDHDESPVPPQVFFWDIEEARATFTAHMDAMLTFSVAEHRRRTPPDMEPPLSEDQLRNLLKEEWSLEAYEVPAPCGAPTSEQLDELKEVLPKPRADFLPD
jgi:hypothetical protein